ncbi:MAG: thiolase family protein [Planctomycetaceae bacterium]|nr:thiolase family protein [Planctomycetaceae bacterium]
MKSVVIIAAQRTPIGRFLGGLAELSAVDLGVAAGEAVLAGVNRSEVDQVILGNVLAAGQGMNIARQIGLKLGLPQETPAFTVNLMCGSGLQSLLLAAQAVRAGEARCVLCGGVESMSQAPYLLPRARTGYKFGDGVLCDAILRDGLVDSLTQQHMGLTAEALARRYNITRSEQDEYALASQARHAVAAADDLFSAELTPVAKVVADEHPRADTTLERLAKLKPAFDPSGTVTAGNASGINDGAACLLLADEDFARSRGYPILAKFVDGVVCGCDPALMGLGPVHAARKLMSRTGTALADYDAVEINEAFAAQVLACTRELQLNVSRINPHGGAIALGHPIGMSGARLAVHVIHQLARRSARRALATLCIGGGMGIAAEFVAIE